MVEIIGLVGTYDRHRLRQKDQPRLNVRKILDWMSPAPFQATNLRVPFIPIHSLACMVVSTSHRPITFLMCPLAQIRTAPIYPSTYYIVEVSFLRSSSLALPKIGPSQNLYSEEMKSPRDSYDPRPKNKVTPPLTPR